MGDQGTSGPAHAAGTRRAEDIRGEDGKEAGRDDTETTGADRPAGPSTARDSTGINPDAVESDSDSPNLPPA